MADLTIDQVKLVYRAAIDARACDEEGADWWEEVARHVHEVCASKSLKGAAAVIDWWHHDWSTVGDSARAAAQRIRQAARSI